MDIEILDIGLCFTRKIDGSCQFAVGNKKFSHRMYLQKEEWLYGLANCKLATANFGFRKWL